MFYSRATNGFYDYEIHGDVIPSDCVEITTDQHRALMEAHSEGQIITSDANGYPIAINMSNSLTWEQIIAQRNVLLAQSDWTDLPNTPIKNREAWLDYRQALRDLTESYRSPQEVVWPSKPN